MLDKEEEQQSERKEKAGVDFQPSFCVVGVWTWAAAPPTSTVAPSLPRTDKRAMARQKGLPGRLSKGAGTHLASWLQESRAL